VPADRNDDDPGAILEGRVVSGHDDEFDFLEGHNLEGHHLEGANLEGHNLEGHEDEPPDE
jgi:RIO kinase 1